jgi:hypothetical protein
LRLTLSLDRAQQPLACDASQHEVELPGHVRGVAQPRAEALPKERRRQMRGVADEQHVTLAHLVGQHRAKLVNGAARERPIFGSVPRLKQRPHPRGILKIRRLLVRQQHELPAPVAGAALHDRRRACRIAALAGDRQPGKRPHVMRLGVHYEPPLLKAEVAAADPARLAHKGVRAVRPDQPLGADRAVFTSPGQLPRLLLAHPVNRQLDMVAPVVQALRDPASLHGHAGGDARMVMDRGLELRLEEHVVGLPPRSRQALDIEPQHQLAVRAEPLVVADRDHLPGQRVGQSERLEQAHDLVIEMDRSGHAIDLLETLEDHHPVPGTPQQRG